MNYTPEQLREIADSNPGMSATMARGYASALERIKALEAERDAAVRELEKRRVPLDYPGDDAAVKQSGSDLGLCACGGRGGDDAHKPSCQFWQGILAARKRWHDRHVVAWSCCQEAKGEEKCETWCGHQRYCTASTRDDISIDAAMKDAK